MKKIILIILIILCGVGLSETVYAQKAETQNNPVIIHFFYGEGCPSCHKADVFLKKMQTDYSQFNIVKYEVFDNKENADLLLRLFESCGEDRQLRVPAIFIGEDVFIGFWNEEISGPNIKVAIKNCSDGGCIDPASKLNSSVVGACVGGLETKRNDGQMISLPFVGEVNLSSLSLPVLTVLLAGIDGFNPCAMWMLIFLLALLMNLRSREKMWLIGGTFILASGIVYYLLMTAWLNIFLAISYVNLVRTAIGILAVVFGALQLKKFRTMKIGVCPVSEGSKLENTFRKKAEKIVSNPKILVSFGGVVLLAFGVNLVEFFCSAGLPAIYTHILSLSNLGWLSYYLYLLLYTVIFMLDDLIIFIIAVITLDKIGFTDKYSRWSTLIGGLIILILGLILILKPELLMFV
ncbi:MAG: hypothetical protein ABH887_02280 [bacterium]